MQRISETELPYSARTASMWSSMDGTLRSFHKFKFLSLPSIPKSKFGKLSQKHTSAIDDIVADLQGIHLMVLANNVDGMAALDVDSRPWKSTQQKKLTWSSMSIHGSQLELTRAPLPTLQRNEPSLIMNIGPITKSSIL
jgi:hypothetical protein